MVEPIEEVYFNWLCAKVVDTRVPNYYDLMRILYSTEFDWLIHADRNRAQDGVELRTDFLRELNMESDPFWFDAPCSVLEMLIAFSDRACFQTDMSSRKWFWIFLNNLGIDEYRRVSRSDIRHIEEILYSFVHRTYDANGNGGILPIRRARHDQREVEIWYQFCEYLEDQGLI